jgi:hypothetical protein
VSNNPTAQGLADWLEPISERFGIGLIVGCGLIVASCISALPSTTCAAMAETYLRALLDFGSVVFIAAPCAFLTYKKAYRASFLFVIGRSLWCVVALDFFLLCGDASVYNLKISLQQCYFAAPVQTGTHARSRVPLAGPFDFDKLRHIPKWDDL